MDCKIDVKELRKRFKKLQIHQDENPNVNPFILKKLEFSNFKIHEICGEAGTGKTNLSIFTMIKAAENGFNSLYISVNKKFPFRRIDNYIDKKYSEEKKRIIEERLKIIELNGLNNFNSCYFDLENFIVEKNIKVIFLDSIASLVETEFINNNGEPDFIERNKFILQFFSKTRTLISNFSLFYFIINNMRDDFQNKENSNEINLQQHENTSFKNKLIPYLGYFLENEVDTVIILSKTCTTRKKMEVLIAHDIPLFKSEFEIKQDNIEFFERKIL